MAVAVGVGLGGTVGSSCSRGCWCWRWGRCCRCRRWASGSARSGRCWWRRSRRRGRWWCPYSSRDIDPTPAINVVWRARSAALGGRDKDSRVIQGVATCLDLVLQAGNGRPQQRHGAGNMRSGHGCAAGNRISNCRRCCGRARVRARSSDIRLYAVAAIAGDRAAAAKASNGIRAGVQRSDRVRSRIKRRRIVTPWNNSDPELPAATTIWIPAAS